MLTIKRYTAAWCGPCKQLAPTFSELQNEILEASFQTIDVDQNRDAAIEANVSSVPTVIFEKDGQVVKRHTGVMSQSQLTSLLGSL